MTEEKPRNRLARGGIGLVAGWSYSAEVFEPLRRELPDQPMVGYDWPTFVDQWLGGGDVANRDPEPSVWVGWSLGGALLLEALRRERIAPELLILVNATPRFLQAPGWPGVAKSELGGLRRAASRHSEAAVAAFRRRFALPAATQDVAATADVAGLDWLAELDLRALLADAPIPIECWLACEDPLVPVDWPSRSTLSSRVSCHRFSGTGHAPWWAEPSELAARLRTC